MIKKILEILPKINKRYPRLNRGGCGVFAKIISEITGYNKFGFLWDNEDIQGDPPAHVYVKVDNKYLDSKGLYTKEEILDEYKGNNEEGYSFCDYGYDELDYWYEDLGEGLFTTDYKPLYKDIKKFILNNTNIIKKFEEFEFEELKKNR